MNQEQLKRYVELEHERRDLDDRLKAVKAETEKLAASLLDQFAEAGMQSARVNGLTVYVHRQLWASAVEGNYEAACQALRASGHGEFVQERFNTNQISALAREMDKNGETLPVEWDGPIKVAETFQLRTQKAS